MEHLGLGVWKDPSGIPRVGGVEGCLLEHLGSVGGLKPGKTLADTGFFSLFSNLLVPKCSPPEWERISYAQNLGVVPKLVAEVCEFLCAVQRKFSVYDPNFRGPANVARLAPGKGLFWFVEGSQWST